MPREVPLPLEERHLLPDPETSYNIAGVGPWEGIVSSRASLPKKVCQSDHAAPLGLRAHATMRTSSQCHGKSVENVRGTFFHIFFGFLGWREPRTWQLGAHGLEENKLSMLSRKGTKHSRVARAMLPLHIVSHDMKLACHFPCFSLSKT